MSRHRDSIWTRRQVLQRLSAAAGAGLLGFGARPALAGEDRPQPWRDD